MGRIKTQLMKKTAEDLVEMHRANLTANFDENKAYINPRIVVQSKKLKNAILGYVTRLIKLKREIV